MEQVLPEPKESSTGQNVLLIVGTLFLLGLVAIMAVNMISVGSTDLQNQNATDFNLVLFDQYDQDRLTLSELRGQVVVINFWASWCVECYKEAALLEEAWQDYKDQDVMFIGVDYLDTQKEALAYIAKYGVTYPNGPDLGSKISEAYAITGVPETFFINKDGTIAHIQIGSIEKPALYGLLDKLVAESSEEL